MKGNVESVCVRVPVCKMRPLHVSKSQDVSLGAFLFLITAVT